MRVREAAALLGVTPKCVTRLVSASRLQYAPKDTWPDGRSPLVDAASLADYQRTRQHNRRWHGEKDHG